MATAETTAQSAFLEECAAQQVRLALPMEIALTSKKICDEWQVGYRKGVLAGVVEAAFSLREYPDYKLADKAIDPTRLTDDIPSRVLAGLINVSLGVKQEAAPHFSVEKQVGQLDDCCSECEDRWGETFEALQPNKNKKTLPLVQIFTDEDDEPVLMRKGRGRPTALLLVDAAMGKNKVVYPAGSVVQISTSQDAYYDDSGVRARKLVVSEHEPEILPVTSIEEMSFLRMTPYQVPNDQRDRHFKRKRLDGVTVLCPESYPMVSEICDIARRAMQADEPAQSKVSEILTNLKRFTSAAFRVYTGDNRYDILA